MNMKVGFLATCVVALMVGCSSSGDKPDLSEQYRYTAPTAVPVKTSAEVNVPYDLLWGRAQHWLAEKGLEGHGQVTGGVLTATKESYQDGLRYLDCGKAGSRVSIAPPAVKINIMITQNASKGVASINVKGTTTVAYIEENGEKVQAPSVTPVCVSNGQLEADFLSYINR
jgi:hypothetical protein